MTTKYDNLQLQRELLKDFITDRGNVQRFLAGTKDEWFTGMERKFIANSIREAWKRNALLIKSELEYELNKFIEPDRHVLYFTEYDLILASEGSSNPDSVMSKLEETTIANNLVDIMIKVSDLVEDGQIGDAVTLVKRESFTLGRFNKDDIAPVELSCIDPRKKLIFDKKTNPNKYKGTNTGLEVFDKRTGGLFPGEMLLIVASTNVGKSVMMRNIAYGAKKQGKSVLHVTNEEALTQVLYKYDALITNISYRDFKRAEILDDGLEKWETVMAAESKQGKLFVKQIPQHSNILEIEKTLVELEEQGHHIDVLILDYIDHISPVKEAWSENDESGKAAADVVGLAISYQIPVVTATQAATVSDKKSRTSALDVYGSKKKAHKANTIMGIKQEKNEKIEEGEYAGFEQVIWQVDVPKNRDGEKFSFKAKMIGALGKVYWTGDDKGLSIQDLQSTATQKSEADKIELEKAKRAEEEKTKRLITAKEEEKLKNLGKK